ncbi:hypothetical protein [Gudongella sp. DL1XJH-153]|uniref:hypothetical protein n=1 Tax=Gudongella sp. DL1XJH-153 TaxID=3409804 RepID=UPI003BB6D68D
MGKKNNHARLLMLILVISMITTGCGGSPSNTGVAQNKNSDLTEWSFSKDISDPLKATAGGDDVTIGDLDTYGVLVHIPGGTFEEPTEVTLVNPDDVPGYYQDEMDGLGAPISISVGEGPVRLMQPVTVTMKYNPDELSEDYESGALYFGYFNENEWQYIKADVDRETETMTFTTSHFCLFSKAKLSMDERVDQYVDNEAVADWLKDQTNSMTDEALNSAIEHILIDNLKIKDKSMIGQIYNSVLEDDEWSSMVDSIKNGDPAMFNQNLQVLLGKKIVENVPASTLSSALEALTGELGIDTVEKASEAAGYVAEGRYKDAAKIIGEHIADKFMITKVGKFAVAAIEGQIQSWKSEEVEAAYQAFKNGASSSVPWWGYQVEKENFEDVWSQMGGAARQLEIEAIRLQNEARADAGMDPLTKEEENKIRAGVKKDLEKEFKSRIQKDAEIEKKKAELQMIMEMYKESGFMEKGRWGWTDSYELETRLDVLMHFKDKLLKDTGRKTIKSGDFHNEEAVAIEQLKTIAMGWFSTDDPDERQKVYEEFLQSEFGISLYPTATELNGVWSSAALIITEFDIGPPPEASGSSESSGEMGCDLSDIDIYNMVKAGLEEQKNQPLAVGMEVSLNASGSGTLSIIDEEGDKSEFAASYNNGLLSASGVIEGTGLTMQGTITKNNDAIALTGSFKMDLSDQAWIKGTWTGNK